MLAVADNKWEAHSTRAAGQFAARGLVVACLFLQTQVAVAETPKSSEPPYEPHRLHGRVEDAGQMNRVARPQSTSGLGQAVKILPGYNYNAQNTTLSTGADDDNLDLSLKTDNFKLPGYKPMTPRSDWLPEQSARGSLQSGRRRCNPCLQTDLLDYSGDGQQMLRLLQMRHGQRFTWPTPDQWNLAQERLSARLQAGDTSGNLMSPLDSGFSLPASPISATPQLQLPDLRVPNWAAESSVQYEENYVLWDEWYQRVADALWRQWKASGKAEPGEADLRITVNKRGSITARILAATNSSESFKNGLLNAARQLSGNPVIGFPPRSQRTEITFDSHFTAGTDTVSGAVSQRNDVEHSRTQVRKR